MVSQKILWQSRSYGPSANNAIHAPGPLEQLSSASEVTQSRIPGYYSVPILSYFKEGPAPAWSNWEALVSSQSKQSLVINAQNLYPEGLVSYLHEQWVQTKQHKALETEETT